MLWREDSGREGVQRAEEAGFQRVAVRTIPWSGRWHIAGRFRAFGIVGPVPQEVGFDLLLGRKSDEDPGGLEWSP